MAAATEEKVEGLSGSGGPKFSQHSQEKKLENLTNSLRDSTSKKKKKRKLFGSIFRKKMRKRLFGEPLDPQASAVPVVLGDLISFLESRGETVGIFRQSASVAEMEFIKKLYESGKEFDWSTCGDTHTIANILLSYLLRLPEPLLCFDLYDSFIAAEEYVVDEESRLNFLRKLLDTLPNGYRIVLERVIGLLTVVAMHSDRNKMSAYNLGIVFGPALMRRKVEDVKQVVLDSPVITRIVSALIEDYAFFFKNGERTRKSSTSEGAPPELQRRGTLAGVAPPPFPEALRAADVLNEPQLQTSEEQPSKEESTKREGEDAASAQQHEKFKALQNMVSSAFINIKHQLTYLSIQLEDRIKTMEDVTTCCYLIKCLKKIINSPPGTVNTVSMILPSSKALYRRSSRLLALTPEITEKIQSLHVKLKTSFADLQTSFKVLETQLYEDTLFMEIGESIDLAVKLGAVAREIKRLLDAFEDSVTDPHLPKDGLSAAECSALEQTADNIELEIKKRLQVLRAELDAVTTLDDAVCLARVIRTVKKAFLNPEDTSLLREVIPKSPRPTGVYITTAAERAKIETICEVVGYGFKEIETQLEEMDINVYTKVQYLKQVDDFLRSFLTQEAPPTQTIDSTFEAALEAALTAESGSRIAFNSGAASSTPAPAESGSKEPDLIDVLADSIMASDSSDSLVPASATPETTVPSSEAPVPDSPSGASGEIETQPSEISSEQTSSIHADASEQSHPPADSSRDASSTDSAPAETPTPVTFEEPKAPEIAVESTSPSGEAVPTTTEDKEEEPDETEAEAKPETEAEAEASTPVDRSQVVEEVRREVTNFYLIIEDSMTVHPPAIERGDEMFDRVKDLTLSTILRLQTSINNIQIEITNSRENPSASAKLAALANELKKMLEPDFNFDDAKSTLVADSSDIEAITAVALSCLDESRGVLLSFNQKINADGTTLGEIAMVQITVERVIAHLQRFQAEFTKEGIAFLESPAQATTPSSTSASS